MMRDDFLLEPKGTRVYIPTNCTIALCHYSPKSIISDTNQNDGWVGNRIVKAKYQQRLYLTVDQLSLHKDRRNAILCLYPQTLHSGHSSWVDHAQTNRLPRIDMSSVQHRSSKNRTYRSMIHRSIYISHDRAVRLEKIRRDKQDVKRCAENSVSQT